MQAWLMSFPIRRSGKVLLNGLVFQPPIVRASPLKSRGEQAHGEGDDANVTKRSTIRSQRVDRELRSDHRRFLSDAALN